MKTGSLTTQTVMVAICAVVLVGIAVWLGLPRAATAPVAKENNFAGDIASAAETSADANLSFVPTAATSPTILVAAEAASDLSTLVPNAMDSEIKRELDGYIRDAMEVGGIPGAEVAIVQDGKVVYLEGFGGGA